MDEMVIIAFWPIPADTTQDFPRGADQEWIERAKKHVEQLHLEVMDEIVGLEGLLNEIKQGAADRFHEKFDWNREEN